MHRQKIDLNFYKMALALAIPIMLQNGITNLVSLLDNVMVGNLCTESMSGVSIANQLLFIFNLTIFGATSGVGIFTAQFHGQKNLEGIRQTLRFKMAFCLVLTSAAMALFWFQADNLIGLFLYESDQGGDLALTLTEGQRYLRTMLLGLLPYALSQCYASTLRETGESLLPMKAGLAAMCVNMALNYVLIFGKLGMPALGVQGAAIATAAARLAECAIIVVCATRRVHRFPYLTGLFSKFTMPSKSLIAGMTARAIPLMINETLWAFATTILTQCYATRGLSAVAAFNIFTTVNNIVATCFMAMGTAAGIIIGNLLGANDKEGAVRAYKRLAIFSVVFSLFFTAFMLIIAPFYPKVYQTSDQVRQLATQFMIVGGLFIPVQAYLNVAYFTLRSGGCITVTFVFDCVFILGISVPLAYFLSRYTDIPAIYLYAVVEGASLAKSLMGFIMIRTGVWLKNLVNT